MAHKPKTRVGTNQLSEGKGMAGLKLNQPPCTVLPQCLSQPPMQCRRLAPSSPAFGWKTVLERVRFFYFYVYFILIVLFNKMEKISIFKKHISRHGFMQLKILSYKPFGWMFGITLMRVHQKTPTMLGPAMQFLPLSTNCVWISCIHMKKTRLWASRWLHKDKDKDCFYWYPFS